MIVKEGDHSIVMVKDRTTRDPAKGVIAADPETDMEATHCGWSSATRVVCRLAGMTGERGLGEFLMRLVAVDADGGNRRVLLNKEKNTGWTVLDFRTAEPETLLVQSGGAVAKLNAKTGVLRVIKRREQDIGFLQHDGAGNVLFAAGVPDLVAREVRALLRARL